MAKKKVHNIVRLERGASPTDYLGMLQIATTVNKGRYIPNFDEGNPYPHVTDSGNAQAADNVGTQGQFPVATTVTSENVATALSLLTATTEVMKVLGKASGGQNNELLTFSNHFFDRLSMRFSRGQDAQIVLRGSCFSDDGSTFPLSSADSADTTAPSASKTKTNNIVSVAHGSIPSPGVTTVGVEVLRGIAQADHDEGELYPIGVDAMLESIELVRNGKAPSIAQDESQATYEGWFKAGEAAIDWSVDGQTLYNLVRAGDPQPGANTTLNGETVSFYDARLLPETADAAPGTIRAEFAQSVGENSVHGSDAAETAAEEISYFFAGTEIVG